MEHNPYAPSQVSTIKQPVSNDAVVITPTALAAILGTQFWVKFMGIIMFIMVAIQVITTFYEVGESPRGLEATPLFQYIIPIISIVVYSILAVRLLQFGSSISALAKTRDTQNFDRAMEVQTKYWKLLGILSIIIIALILYVAFIEISNSPFYR